MSKPWVSADADATRGDGSVTALINSSILGEFSHSSNDSDITLVTFNSTTDCIHAFHYDCFSLCHAVFTSHRQEDDDTAEEGRSGWRRENKMEGKTQDSSWYMKMAKTDTSSVVTGSLFCTHRYKTKLFIKVPEIFQQSFNNNQYKQHIWKWLEFVLFCSFFFFYFRFK